MAESGTGSRPAGGVSTLLRLAAAPAIVLGRLRPDVAADGRADVVRFAGAQRAFAILALLAVIYPIAASGAHALGDPTPGGDLTALALRPAFDVVYAESLPFMLVALAIGLTTPALGVLFMVVFVVADLFAASQSTSELATMHFQLPFGAFAARVSSYILLWILVVEIPLRARSLGRAWTRRSPGAAAFAMVVAATFMAYLWITALPWLVGTVYTWSALQVVANWAIYPAWRLWPLFVGAAAIVALVAALLPVRLERARDDEEPVPDPRFPPFGLGRQVLVAALAALVLGALVTTEMEGVVLVLGVMLVGPVLSAILPRVPRPSIFTGIPSAARWFIGLLLALGAGVAISVVIGSAMFADGYLLFIVTLLIVIAILRFVLEAGGASQSGAGSLGQDLRPSTETSPARQT